MSKKSTKNMTTLEGMMTYSKLDNGLNALDFAAYERAEMEAFTATCRVQAMRDGNVYITEMKKRVRNKPLFRDDNSTFSLGHDGRYYFVFSMPQEQLSKLPDALVHQALVIAQKVENKIKR